MSDTCPGPMEYPRTRLELQQFLENSLGFGDDHIAYQAPGDEKSLKRPSWYYRLSDMNEDFADNIHYKTSTCYELTHVSKDPDSKYVLTMRQWPMTRFLRSYVKDGLNHWVFRIWTQL